MAQQEQAVITMKERAASKMASLLRERGEAAQIRVFVEGGGCSGYRYGLAPSPDKRDEDIIVAQGELTVLIDRESIDLVRGASIDFVEDVMRSGFTIDNPNAVSTCGCGSSFKTEGGGEGDRCC
jgi:iron-sulfur cluster assembly protein